MEIKCCELRLVAALEPRLPKEREAQDQTPSRQAAQPVCAKLETVKEPGQRAAAAGLALGFLL